MHRCKWCDLYSLCVKLSVYFGICVRLFGILDVYEADVCTGNIILQIKLMFFVMRIADRYHFAWYKMLFCSLHFRLSIWLHRKMSINTRFEWKSTRWLKNINKICCIFVYVCHFFPCWVHCIAAHCAFVIQMKRDVFFWFEFFGFFFTFFFFFQKRQK